MKQYILEVHKGLFQQEIFTLDKEATLGRDPRNTITLTNPSVSRRHARIAFQEGQWVLYDTESRNGTFVNGQRIQNKALRNGDQISVGPIAMRFVELEMPGDSALAQTEDSSQWGQGSTREASLLGQPQGIREQMDVVSPLLDALPLGIAILNEKMEVRYLNVAIASLWSFSGEYKEGSLGYFLGCSGSKEAAAFCGSLAKCAKCPFHTVVERALREGKAILDMETHWPKSDESTGANVRFSVRRLPERLTEEPLALLTWEDITSLNLSKEAFSQSEERYNFLVESTANGYFIFDIASGRFLFLNRRFCGIFGYRLSEALELSVWDVIAEVDHGRIREQIQSLRGLALRRSAPLAYTAVRRDGSNFQARIAWSRATHQGKKAVQGSIIPIL